MAARGRIIQVAQPLELRRDLAAAAALRSLRPLLIFAPLMALLIWLLVDRALRPVQRLVLEVKRRDAASLEPLPENALPSEVEPVAHAINSLPGRLKRAFDSQRASRLIEQLLTAARTAPGEAPPPLAPRDLAETARAALADAWPQAEARRIELALEAPAPVAIHADDESLRILMRNLLDNAIRYTPPGGQVAVNVARRGGEALLTVDDNGPGIPAAERGRAFQRFYRGQSQAANNTGSGLGLAIVANIAARHGAQVTLADAPLGGLRVDVRFPLPS